MALIRQHPVIGENILKPVVELQQIARIVRSHHERYDGRGYPDGLKGQAIPIGRPDHGRGRHLRRHHFRAGPTATRSRTTTR